MSTIGTSSIVEKRLEVQRNVENRISLPILVGNPLGITTYGYVQNVDKPFSEVFTEAMRARGMITPSGRRVEHLTNERIKKDTAGKLLKAVDLSNQSDATLEALAEIMPIETLNQYLPKEKRITATASTISQNRMNPFTPERLQALPGVEGTAMNAEEFNAVLRIMVEKIMGLERENDRLRKELAARGAAPRDRPGSNGNSDG